MEGFGLPPLEAMACDTPVVCSRAISLPEVAGDAAILVDPSDVEQIVDAMRLALTQPALAAALRARGLARAAQFTWERTARETIAVYGRVVRGRGTMSDERSAVERLTGWREMGIIGLSKRIPQSRRVVVTTGVP